MYLIKGDAPACPKCGCNATKLVGAGERFGRPWARFECDFCRYAFTFGQKPNTDGLVNGVVFRPIRCPKCNSKDVVTTSTRGKVRLHKCRSCTQAFKSVEAS